MWRTRTERKLCGAEFSGSLLIRLKAVEQGARTKNRRAVIWPRLTGLAHFAPAEGRQARPDLSAAKSGKPNPRPPLTLPANPYHCGASSLEGGEGRS
ncbi:MAG: hypothetical protein JWS10_287 [Cypionkella sp.]|nr:hypothetical protein [Cypionkella sp.]